jgi:hypothetical protein
MRRWSDCARCAATPVVLVARTRSASDLIRRPAVPAEASSVDGWSQLVLKETRGRTEQLKQAPKTGIRRLDARPAV